MLLLLTDSKQLLVLAQGMSSSSENHNHTAVKTETCANKTVVRLWTSLFFVGAQLLALVTHIVLKVKVLFQGIRTFLR